MITVSYTPLVTSSGMLLSCSWLTVLRRNLVSEGIEGLTWDIRVAFDELLNDRRSQSLSNLFSILLDFSL